MPDVFEFPNGKFKSMTSEEAFADAVRAIDERIARAAAAKRPRARKKVAVASANPKQK